MKGAVGLVIAVGLGVFGAFCNWFYLAQKSRELEKVQFIGISDNRPLNAGDVFQDTDLVPIGIPAANVGNLALAAPLYADKNTVVGTPAPKSYVPGEIVLRLDLQRPPPNDPKPLLGENEVLLWIPVDTRTFVAAHVNPGDFVSFVVPRGAGPRGPQPTPVGEPPATLDAELIGPVRIISLGNRLGSVDVMRAAGQSPVQENVMGIAVKVSGGKFDTLGERLSRMVSSQPVQVVLHGNRTR